MNDEPILIGELYCSSMFTYQKSTKTFFSSLDVVPGVLRELWHNDVALGFGICSIKTGGVVFFELNKIVRSEENPKLIVAWIFNAVNPTDNPLLTGMIAMIAKSETVTQ